MPSWWLDETTYAGPEHLDPAYVEGYEHKAGYAPDADVALLRDLGVDATSTVLDVGAGTGRFALAMAPHCRQVIAVDVSPAMVAVLRDRAASAGVANLRVEQAGFLSLPDDLGPVDAVYTRNVLHQLPDLWKLVALRSVAAVLRPGGVLVLHDLVVDAGPDDLDAVMDAWLAGAVDDPAVGWTADEYATHLRTEFSTYTWILEGLLERTGFDILTRATRSSVYATYTCRRP
jgi:ubiquinone/menaquinone biosynthesis C-methylase UbiE